jgi:hypothetical protein
MIVTSDLLQRAVAAHNEIDVLDEDNDTGDRASSKQQQ